MARTVRDAVLSSRMAHARLQSSGKPYYKAIDAGLRLGYRKGKSGIKWFVCSHIGKRGCRVETIGVADDVIDANGTDICSFAQAHSEARSIFPAQQREQSQLSAKSRPVVFRRAPSVYRRCSSTSQATAKTML